MIKEKHCRISLALSLTPKPDVSTTIRRYSELDRLADAVAPAIVLFAVGIVWYIQTHLRQLLLWGIIVAVAAVAVAIAVVVIRKRRKNVFSDLDDAKILRMLKGGTPAEFERDIAEMFDALGYRTERVGGANDGGIDVRVYKDGKTYFIQCKKFITQEVTPHDVRDFLGAVTNINDPAEKGFFITTNGFTLAAEKATEGNPRIELIDGLKLVQYWKMAFGKTVPESVPAAPPAPAPVNINACPQCGGELVLRTAKHGANAGRQFWGCSNFTKTKCGYIRNIS